MSFTAASLLTHMMQLPKPNRYQIAFSGGCDSTALVHALNDIRDALPAPLSAVHINHGLQAAAFQWQEHCQKICERLNIPLTIAQVHAKAAAGESPEAAARSARYQAMVKHMCKGDMILTAHHQDDQAETVLLQMLRGGGVNGLAAMPLCNEFGSGTLARPLLGFTRSMLESYCHAHQLTWIEDPSNAHSEFDRNFLRLNVVPVLHQRWPQYSAILGRVARHQAEAAELLHDLAQLDWHTVRDEHQTVHMDSLLTLTPSRQRNVIRYWLKVICGLPLPDTLHLARILDELIPAREDAVPMINWDGAQVRRYQRRLYAMPPLVEYPQQDSIYWEINRPLDLPDCELTTRITRGRGIRLDKIHGAVQVRFRQGGEILQLPGREHHHELKKLLQEWNVPPWVRERLPLIYIGDELACVVGHAVTAPFAASTDEAGIEFVCTSHGT